MKAKFSGKRPVMFYQKANDTSLAYIGGDRIRIFYPDGRTEWCTLALSGIDYDDTDLYQFVSPCWENVSGTLRSRNMVEAIARANAYDQSNGWGKMKFLGEL
jgi:hypothetical protein